MVLVLLLVLLWLLWLFLTRAENESHVYVDTTRKLIGKGALDDEELFTIEGSENWRLTPDNLEEREKCRTTAKKPFTPAKSNTAESWCTRLSVAQLE